MTAAHFAVTVKLIVQTAPALTLPPLNVTELAPALIAVDTTPEPQVVFKFAGDAMSIPLGRLSVNPMPVRSTAPGAVFAMVIVSVDVPPEGIVVGLNCLLRNKFGATLTAVTTLAQLGPGAHAGPGVGGLAPPVGSVDATLVKLPVVVAVADRVNQGAPAAVLGVPAASAAFSVTEHATEAGPTADPGVHATAETPLPGLAELTVKPVGTLSATESVVPAGITWAPVLPSASR